MHFFRGLRTVSCHGSFRKAWRFRISSKNITTMSPHLLRRLEDGTEEVVKEEDLFKSQRYRWLSNESERLAIRYRKFNLQALIDIAVGVKGSSKRSCIKVLKCVEGQFNKVFILTMDDGEEVVAKLPNPNAGPSFYTLASEVATRQFLSSVLGIPIPHIYAWSSDASNPVGAEYIIEEKAGGQQLGSVWFQWSKELQLDVVNQIDEIEAKLASFSFSKHGSIYYKSDLEKRGVKHETLDFGIVRMAAVETRSLEDFAIGPSTDPRLWTDTRATMDLSRGPWTGLVEYVKDIGLNELQWATSHAKPRMNFHRSMEHPETPNDYISLLQRYLKLAPYLITACSEGESIQTISHPDLHLDNIFVNPNTKRISAIIDWQSTTISPTFLQRIFPRFLEPLNGSTPSPDSPLIHYQHLVKRRDPLRRAMMDDRYHSIKTKPIHLVPGCWDRDDLFSLRNSLISVIANWEGITANSSPCPIIFTEEELASHQNEMDLIEGLSSIMHQLQNDAMIPLGGMVRPGDYERLKKLNKGFLKDFIDLGEDARQRALHAKVWPYPDT